MADEDTIDFALMVVTTGFAVWLDHHKEHEPDWTWVEVAAGSAVCLVAAYFRTRAGGGGDWKVHNRNVWRAFILGGLPIIAGEVSQALRRRDERINYRRLMQ